MRQARMPTILLVDDEKPFLLSLRDGLITLDRNFRILTANNGQQAVEVLTTRKVDLLVTDLKMPIMDGFELLAYVSRCQPELPVIVMTAFGTPDIEARLSKIQALHYLEKPLDFDHLTRTIDNALAEEKHSYIRGITLATFLQLVHMEQKSCTLKVHSRGRVGYLYLRGGALLDAETGDLHGEEAAYRIVAWDDAEIEMDSICRKQEKKIEATLEFLLMEAFRIKDEDAAAEAAPDVPRNEGLPENHFGNLLTDKEDAPRSSMNPTQPATNAPDKLDPNLLERLEKTSEILEYAIFDAKNFLEHKSREPCSLSGLDPSYLFQVGEEMEAYVGCGTLSHVMVKAGQKNRFLFFRHGSHRIAISLKPGSRPKPVMEQLAEDLF
ncbi:hypothetical protein B5V00_05865 [Geothermobacter hydrogeniphilus]|uniref:Response regulatory domain-containing protein n=2 Tax=Geothermobacter hydrogeniphilus TaxID=1969733 RepID=A0A1X0Y961_9BACT|nr:hypothetical protein B5V00_05865 [Geothermobacter hydrogeniphilus]